MSQVIQLTTATSLDKDTTVAFDEKPVFVHDYAITWNVGSTLNSLFNVANFKQDTTDPDLYNINLELNAVMVKSLLNKTGTDTNSTISRSRATELGMVGMEAVAVESLGDRLLEIIALKLFGDASARAAIVNDSTFTSDETISEIVNGQTSSISKSFNTDMNKIFNGYVALNRITALDDVNNPVTFNFDNLIMEVPLWINGDVSASLTGPTAVGGAQIVAGAYEIPLLLRFDGSTK